LNLDIPVIYAGNVENQDDVKDLFKNSRSELYIVENVYPKIDELNVEPTRKVIQDVFEKHIVHAPGMQRVREMVTGSIIPTPGAVMVASKLLYDDIGDLMTLDVGGATTDVHSVTEGNEEVSRILISPEPLAKRTVEGDLGVYVNMHNVVDMVGKEKLEEELNLSPEELQNLIDNHKPIPKTDLEKAFVEKLTLHAAVTAVKRHAGIFRYLYGSGGRTTVAEGKDLTRVKYIIGTGGALTRLPHRVDIMREIPLSNKGHELLPNKDVEILVDNDYIMASLGILSKEYPQAALRLLKNSLNIK